LARTAYARQERSSPQFFNLLAFILASCPTPPNEEALRTQFASIGIEAGKPFDAGANVDAYLAGMAAGQKQIDVARAAVKSAQGLFGTPEAMQGMYLERAVAAQYGILGNTAEEAMYLGYADTPDGRPLTGANAYTLTFAKDALPPANAFWSVTLYEAAAAAAGRKSPRPLLDQLADAPRDEARRRRRPDALHSARVTGEGSRSELASGTRGPLLMVLRVYYPKQSVLDGSWQQPRWSPPNPRKAGRSLVLYYAGGVRGRPPYGEESPGSLGRVQDNVLSGRPEGKCHRNIPLVAMRARVKCEVRATERRGDARSGKPHLKQDRSKTPVRRRGRPVRRATSHRGAR